MVRNDEEVLQALRDLKVEHGGELCVFTVQVGNSDRGRALLQKMATVNGCGKFYDGDSLNSAGAMNALVRDIFVGQRAVAQVAAVPDRPAAERVVFSLDNVHFENDIHVVHPKYSNQLDEVAATMRDNPGLRLRLHGHTDSNASVAYNQGLSERRVNAVAAALTQRGVSSSRIETRAHGELQPAVPNTTPQNMHMNRRVELTPIQ
jgi:OOP family OmpA-OmpF porin